MNILIYDTDEFYQFGLVKYINELFNGEKKEIIFADEYPQKNDYSDSDIIILSIHQGEQYTCVPDLCFSIKKKLLVITEKVVNADESLPWCFSEALFINRRDSLESVGKTIKMLKETFTREKTNTGLWRNCFNCKKRSLSAQQSLVMTLLCNNINIIDISKIMGVGVKTIYSHKDKVMKTFNLHSECELLKFLFILKNNRSSLLFLNHQQ